MSGFWLFLFRHTLPFLFIVNSDHIPNLKWTIKKDNKIAEQVTKNFPCSKRNCNTANTESCNYSGNIKAKIVHQEHNSNHPNEDVYQHRHSSELSCFFLSAFLLFNEMGYREHYRRADETNDEKCYDK